MKRTTSTTLVLLLILSNTASARNPQESENRTDPSIGKRFDDYVRAEMARQRIPGLAIGVYRNGEIIKAQGFGVANVKSRVAVSPETIFQSGSTAKQFTATAIMMLVEDGKIGLDDSITKYFLDAPQSWNSIKIRNLLSHTSGLREYVPGDPLNAKEPINLHKDYAPAKLLKIIESFPTDSQPGDWAYRNTNYFLLGLVIEKVTGKFWGDFLQERIFRPLGMNSTGVLSDVKKLPDRADGYLLWQRQIPLMGVQRKFVEAYEVASTFNRTADGCLYFNVLDLAKWDAALYTEKLLKKSSLDQMWTVAEVNDGSPNRAHYGFGWRIEISNGHKLIEHDGERLGFKTHIARYPDDKLSIVVLMNQDSIYSSPVRIAHSVAAMYMPSLAAAQSPKIPDEPKVTALVRNVIRNLRSGKPPAGWTRDEIRDLRSLDAFGPLTSLQLIRREDASGTRNYVYRLVFRDFECPFEITLTADDRITHLSLRDD